MSISAQSFFMLLFTYEGLSLWESQAGLPGWKRRQYLREKWNRKIKESDNPDKMEAVLSCAKETLKFNAFMILARIIRWMPSVLSLGALVFYLSCPLFFGTSALAIFNRACSWFCCIAIGLSIAQFVVFMLTSHYFENFDAETLVNDASKQSADFDLAS